MNTQRSRLSWLVLSFLATFACVHCARAAVVGSVKGTNELYFNINPRSGNTNYMTIGDAGVVDGTAAIWSWDAAGSLDGSFDRVGSWYSVGSGAWVRNFTGINVGGTNIFNTIIVTNLTVTTNLYLTTNTFIVIGGNTNQAGLWTDFGTFIAPTAATNVTHVGTDGYIHIAGPTFSELQLDGPTLGSMIDIYSDDSQRYVHLQTHLNGIMLEAVMEPTLIEGGGTVPGSGGYWFGTETVYTNTPIFALYNGTNAIVTGQPSLTFGPTAGMNFGAGGTNRFYLSGSNQLIYSNGVPVFRVLEGVASAEIGVQSSIPYVSGTSYLELIGGAANLTLDGVVTPKALYGSVPIALGQLAYPMHSAFFTNSDSIHLGTNILGYSGNNLTWNGVNITVP